MSVYHMTHANKNNKQQHIVATNMCMQYDNEQDEKKLCTVFKCTLILIHTKRNTHQTIFYNQRGFQINSINQMFIDNAGVIFSSRQYNTTTHRTYSVVIRKCICHTNRFLKNFKKWTLDLAKYFPFGLLKQRSQ